MSGSDDVQLVSNRSIMEQEAERQKTTTNPIYVESNGSDSDVPRPKPLFSRQLSKTFIQFNLDDVKEEPKPDKKKHNGYSITILLSVLYAIIVTFVGLCFPLTEAIKERWLQDHWVAAFLVYLYVVSTAFILYVQIYHVDMEKKRQEHTPEKQITIGIDRGDNYSLKGSSSAANLHQLPLGSINEGFTLQEGKGDADMAVSGSSQAAGNIASGMHRRRINSTSRDSVEGNGGAPPPYISDISDSASDVHEYIVLKSGTASMSHEGGGNLYLRLGCLLFAIANIIYIAFRIRNFFGPCPFSTIVYPFFFYMIFILVQTYFLFKNCTVVIKRHQGLVRFGVMHVLATNLCNWLRVLIFEIMEAIIHADEGGTGPEYNETSISDELDVDGGLFAGGGDGNDSCSSSDSLWLAASPYLFPFILEYSLIAVAAMATIYSSLNITVTKDILDEVKKALKRKETRVETTQAHEHQHEETFQKAHIGMYIGILILAGLLVSIILFFHYNLDADLDTRIRSDLIHQITDITLGVAMLIATIIGMVQLFNLGYDMGKNNTIDHALLLISLVGLLVLELFALIASFSSIQSYPDFPYMYILILNCVGAFVKLVQGVLQSIFIIDGLQRFAETDEQAKRKPGRAVITFLIVANVGAWIIKTLQEKRRIIQEEEDFLGIPTWPIVMNISLPLLLFFRFHCSICLAEMWHSNYEKEDHKNIIEEKILD